MNNPTYMPFGPPYPPSHERLPYGAGGDHIPSIPPHTPPAASALAVASHLHSQRMYELQKGISN